MSDTEPFADIEAANQAVQAFNAGLRELREKHKIPDVTVVIRGTAMRDGEESQFYLTSHHGDALQEENMLAYAFGVAQERRQELTARLLGKAKTLKKLKAGK